VVVFIVHLEWGPSSTSNILPSGRSLTAYFYINKLPRLGKGGAQFAPHRPLLSLELGTPRLAYGFALAASTLVDPLRGGFLTCGAVSMAARRMSQLPKKRAGDSSDGGVPVATGRWRRRLPLAVGQPS
jgi:hypothetical protein